MYSNTYASIVTDIGGIIFNNAGVMIFAIIKKNVFVVNAIERTNMNEIKNRPHTSKKSKFFDKTFFKKVFGGVVGEASDGFIMLLLPIMVKILHVVVFV